jgi:hypothetical protein
VEFGPLNHGHQRRTHGAGSAAEIKDDGSRTGERRSFANEELSATTRHEDARIQRDPKTAERCPPEDLFEWDTGDTPADHRVEFGRRAGRLDEQLRFILGVDTAGGTQPRDQRLLDRYRSPPWLNVP